MSRSVMDWARLLQNHEYDCVGAVVLDQAGTIQAVSDGVLDMSGFSRDELLAMAATDLVHPDDVRRGVNVLAEVFVTPGTRADGMYRLRQADQSYESFALRAINLGAEFDDAIVIRFTKLDANHRVSAEAFSEDVVDATRMLCQETNLSEFLSWAMRVGERHVPGLELIVTILNSDGPNQIHSRRPVPEDMTQANMAASATVLPPHVQASLDEHNQGPWLAPNRVATRDAERPERLTSIIEDSTGGIAGYIEILRPTTSAPPEAEWLLIAMITRVITAAMQRFDLDSRLRWAAEHDPLTSLVNRRKLVETMTKNLDTPSYLYLIDLDGFSWINNTFGHLAGDDVLVAVSSQLTAATPPGAVIARMGGDEFVVWIPGSATARELGELGEQLRSALRVELGSPDRRSRLRSSIGAVALAPGDSPATAISKADAAMYESKRGGGDSVTVS